MRTIKLVLSLGALVVLLGCAGAPTDTQQASDTTAPAPAEPTAEQPAPPPAQPSAQPAPPAPAQASQRPPTQRPAATTSQPSTTGSSPTATAHVPPPPPKPQSVEMPAGTLIEMELVDDLSSKTNQAGDTFKAKVVNAIEIGGQTVVPEGSIVEGTVTQAVSAKKMTGQAVLVLQFSRIDLSTGGSVAISGTLTQKGKKIGKRTGAIVGGSAAGGAVLGKILGKDTKSALLGAAIGAAAGTGVAASQKGQELKLPAGSGINIETDAPAQVPVPSRRS